jgi:hypothetical protein
MNMNKAYRAELRDLKRAERNTNRDFHVGHAEIQRAYREADSRLSRAISGRGRALTKIKRRRAILEGRLS